jgi:hypothetical protein
MILSMLNSRLSWDRMHVPREAPSGNGLINRTRRLLEDSYIESCNAGLGEELLYVEIFHMLREAQTIIEMVNLYKPVASCLFWLPPPPWNQLSQCGCGRYAGRLRQPRWRNHQL